MLDLFAKTEGSAGLYTSNELLLTKISEIEFTILDFETTGLYPFNGDRIIEFGLYRMDSKGGFINKKDSLINPERPIPDEVSKINGISDEMVKDAPKIEQKIDEILNFMKTSVIVGHNLMFDISFLKYELQKLKKQNIELWMVDTIKVAKKIFPEFKSYSLQNITKELKIKNKNAHRALADCEATGELLRILIEKISNNNVLKELEPFKIQ